MQWTTGAVTVALLGLQTLGTIAHDGIWRFIEESRHILGPELWTQVILAIKPSRNGWTMFFFSHA